MAQTKEQRRAFHEKHKERLNQACRDGYAKNREERCAKARAYSVENKDVISERLKLKRQTDPRVHLFNGAKMRAKREGIPFNLTIDDCEVPQFCPVLGLKFEIGVGRPIPSSPTLDKIEPELGYVKGNVIVVSFMANLMKSNATIEQLMTVARFYENLEIARQLKRNS